VFLKVEAPFANKMGKAWLPTFTTNAGDDALGASQRSEDALDFKGGRKVVEEVGTFLRAPEFGKNQDVGVKILHDIERSSWTSPSVNTSVKVKCSDTHR
jgi:hypothetical protein